MRISRLSIDGFGHFCGVDVPDLPDGLVVFQGANEAGKSTCLAFVHTVLFGFPDGRSRERPFPPLNGGDPGGRLHLVSRSLGEVVVDRRPGPRGGPVQVIRSDGSVEGEPALRAMLGGVDRTLYRNLYGFSLTELQNLENLTSDQLREVIYGASFGASAQSLPAARQTLQSRLESLFKPGGQKPEINVLLKRLEEARARVRDASALQGEYEATVGRLRQLDDEISGLDGELSETRRTLQLNDALLRAWGDWTELLTLRGERQDLPILVTGFPDGALERLGALTSRVEASRSSCAAQERELDATRRALDELVVDERLISQSAEIKDLAARLVSYQETLSESRSVAGALEAATAAVEELVGAFGPGWTEERALGVDRSPQAVAVVDAWRQKLTDLRQEHQKALTREADLEEEHRQLEQQVREIQEEISRLSGDLEDTDPEVVETLRRGRDELATAIRDLPTCTEQRRSLESSLARTLAEIEAGWTRTELDRVDTSVIAEQRIGDFEQRLGEARLGVQLSTDAVTRAEDEAAGARRLVDSAAQRLEDLRATLAAALTDPEAARRTLRRLRSTLARRARLEESVRDLGGRLDDLKALAAASASGSPPHTTAFRRLAAVLGTLGAALLVAGILQDQDLPLVAAGAALIVTTVIVLVASLRSSAASSSEPALEAGARKEALERQLETARQEAEGLNAEITGLAASVDLPGNIAEGDIDAAEEALQTLSTTASRVEVLEQDLQRVTETLALATAKSESARSELDQARQALGDAEAEWQSFVRSYGLTRPCSPATLRQVVARAGVARDQLKEIDALGDRLERIRETVRQLREVAGRAFDLASLRGLPDTELVAAVDRFLDRQDAQEVLRGKLAEMKAALHTRNQDLAQSARRLEQGRTARRAAEETLTLAVSEWRDWLRDRGLDDSWQPDSCRSFLAELGELARQVAARRDAGGAAARNAEALSGYRADVERVFEAAGRPAPRTPDVPVEVRRLEEQRELHVKLRDRRELLAQEIDAEAEALVQARQELESAEAALAALLAEGGATTEAELRHRERLHRRLLTIDSGLKTAEQNLRKIVGRPALEEIEAMLASSTREDLEAEGTRLAAHETDLAGRLRALSEERARAMVRRQDLETNNSVADARADEESLLAEIESKAEEWCRLALARHLLDRAKERFEETHQPRVIQEAGRFFSTITDGRYQRVFTPHGEARIEAVDRDGRRLSSEVLSRGTQEQLYLSIRFGYIAARQQEGAQLPIVMDDVLVNFDPDRAFRAAQGIAEVARSNQVLFFTCHPATVEIFQRVAPGVRVFEMSQRDILPAARTSP